MSTWTAGMASFRTVASAFNVILGRCGREIPGVLGQVAPKLGFRRVLSFLAQHARVRSCSAFADLLPTGATKRSGCRTSSSRKTCRALSVDRSSWPPPAHRRRGHRPTGVDPAPEVVLGDDQAPGRQGDVERVRGDDVLRVGKL